MRLFFVILILIAGFFSESIAQNPFADHELLQAAPKVRRAGLPVVSFEYQNQQLMRAFAPDFYNNERQIARDIRWVDRNDSLFLAQWDLLGDSILALIEDLSGIKWIEPHINVHLVKYASVEGMYDPLVIPMKGIKRKHYDEAIPTGLHQLFNLIKYFSGRNLMQTELPGRSRSHIADHPLMQKTVYRFDNLAMSLATAVADSVIPTDSLEILIQTEIWRRHNPGWDIYLNNFKPNWILTIETPLVSYLENEPYSSDLVKLTRPPRIVKKAEDEEKPAEPVKLTAGAGRLGFSVFKNTRKYLEVIDVDSSGIGFQNGLLPGDQIKRVNGEYARNARVLMGRILDKIDGDGVYLIVSRDGEETGILLLPPSENYNPIEEF